MSLSVFSDGILLNLFEDKSGVLVANKPEIERLNRIHDAYSARIDPGLRGNISRLRRADQPSSQPYKALWSFSPYGS
jgi:hypothetical protein